MHGPSRKRSISYIIIKINDNIIKLDTSSYKKFEQELERNKKFLESQFKIMNQKIVNDLSNKANIEKSKQIDNILNNDENDIFSNNNNSIFSIDEKEYELNYFCDNEDFFSDMIDLNF